MLYLGLAKVAAFIDAANEMLVARGVELPLPSQSATTPETRMAKGYALQAEIIGRERIEGLYANAPGTRCTSSATSRLSASATPTLAAASTCPSANS